MHGFFAATFNQARLISAYQFVLDIVSKYRSFDTSKYGKCFALHPLALLVFFMQILKRKLRCIPGIQISKSYICRLVSLLINIVSNSIPKSIFKTLIPASCRGTFVTPRSTIVYAVGSTISTRAAIRIVAHVWRNYRISAIQGRFLRQGAAQRYSYPFYRWNPIFSCLCFTTLCAPLTGRRFLLHDLLELSGKIDMFLVCVIHVRCMSGV